MPKGAQRITRIVRRLATVGLVVLLAAAGRAVYGGLETQREVRELRATGARFGAAFQGPVALTFYYSEARDLFGDGDGDPLHPALRWRGMVARLPLCQGLRPLRLNEDAYSLASNRAAYADFGSVQELYLKEWRVGQDRLALFACRTRSGYYFEFSCD